MTPLPASASEWDDPQGRYQPGQFQTSVQNAQRAQAYRLPGSVTPRVAGISFQAPSSLQKTVKKLTEGLRCADMQVHMQRGPNPLTPQLMDRALQLEGCGPHIESTPADATIDAIAHDAVFGH
jgi:hypothetical protein